MTQNGDTTRRTEVAPEIVFLGKLLERVAAGKLRIPRFQRPFVWKHPDMTGLLDSVLKGYPIGAILVWETHEAIQSLDHVGPVQVGELPVGTVAYLLDGQQRLSTLVGTLRLPEGVRYRHDVDWQIYCDLVTGEFVHEPRRGLEPQHFPVRSLLDTKAFFAACREIEQAVGEPGRIRELLDAADRLASAFRDYQLPLIKIESAGLDSAVTVFARLNRRGRTMTADQMVSALTYREGDFHLAERLDEFQEELSHRGFKGLDRVFILRAVLAALDLDLYAKDWAADLVVKDEVRARLPAGFDQAADGVRRALGFVAALGVTSDRLLPYGLQLVLLGEFFRLCPKPSDDVRALLERWFWVTSFTGWFGGVNSTRARLALDEMRDVARHNRTTFDIVDLDARAQPFPERFDGRSARVRAFLLYLASLQPRSILDEPGDARLRLGPLFAEQGPNALGYVVSSSTAELYSSPANRMFVDGQHIGQAIGRLQGLSPSRAKLVLPSHGFPRAAVEHLASRDRVALLEARLEALIDGEREFLKQRGVALPLDRTGTTVADSDSSTDD